MSENKDKIKLKIRALLAKTTENGATESEMLEAMAKASELMEKYFINENDLNDPFLGEKCVFVSTPILKTRYQVCYFYGYLAQLFDCEYYFTKIELTFFGFENDVELCVYFYRQIVKTCFFEAEKYKDSREYAFQKRSGYHGSQIIKSFVKGFILRVCDKLEEIYKERQAARTTERGLILREKSQRVKEAFDSEDIKINIRKFGKISVLDAAFNAGKEKGNEFNITQGIKQGKQSSRVLIGKGVQNG
jgi:hypothetical protein